MTVGLISFQISVVRVRALALKVHAVEESALNFKSVNPCMELFEGTNKKQSIIL